MPDKTPSPGEGQGQSKTVVILEPEEHARNVLCEYLRHCGYEVLGGTSAEDAYKELRGGRAIDFILADVQLHGAIDGHALSRELKKTHPEIEVILTYGPNAAADKAGELCDHGPLKKPFPPEEVVLRIRRLRGQ